MWSFWLTVVIVLSIIEVSTVNLVSIWFIASAIVSLVISLVYPNWFLEFFTFVILGVVLLVTTKPIIKKYIKIKPAKTNLDRVVGMKGIVTENISKHKTGEVKVDGKFWSAQADKTIKKDEEVIVEKIDGVKLLVRKEDK